MKKVFSFIINRHQEVLRYLMLLLTALIITNWIPKVSKFKYEFEESKPWKHENLIAPFNFAIQKSEKEVQEEEQSVLKTVNPYYNLDPEVAVRNKKIFSETLKNKFQREREAYNISLTDSALYRKIGLKILDSLYNKGIIIVNDNHKETTNGGDFKINLLRNNTAEVVNIKDLYKIKKAYQFAINKIKNQSRINSDFLIPILEQSIEQNVFYDQATTDKILQETKQGVSNTRGVVQEGEIIISRGTVIDKERYNILQSFKDEYQKRVTGDKVNLIISLGYFIIIALIMTFFALFMFIFYKEVFFRTKHLSFVLLILILASYFFHWSISANLPSYYVLPFCIVPIVIRTFFGARMALFTHLMVVLIAGYILPVSFSYLSLHLIAGMAALFANINARYWSQFFVSTALILLTYSLGFFALTLIQEGSYEGIELSEYAWLGVNVLLVLIAYPLIPVFEKVFGLVSEITLVELSDLNKPLLKKLSLEAPGTFQHSLQVSNLAEAAANEIGANAMLVKVGALYHDIGKMYNPLYFIENQNTGINPHDDLSFEESAQIIIGHVLQGIDMAKKQKIPGILIDFIRTHHGTLRVEYFYRSHLKSYPDQEIDEENFRYPGPAPFSKETAILMMADSVEAASKSLKNPTAEDIDTLIDGIVAHQMEHEQFANSNITFKDITTAKKVFKHMIKNIYHVRIAYPERKGK